MPNGIRHYFVEHLAYYSFKDLITLRVLGGINTENRWDSPSAIRAMTRGGCRRSRRVAKLMSCCNITLCISDSNVVLNRLRPGKTMSLFRNVTLYQRLSEI